MNQNETEMINNTGTASGLSAAAGSGVRSKWRGHPIRFDGQVWRYCDTDQPTADNPRRECGKCGLPPTAEDHDGCLGTLPNVRNACCGHGSEAEAYVQFNDGSDLRSKAAIMFFDFQNAEMAGRDSERSDDRFVETDGGES